MTLRHNVRHMPLQKRKFISTLEKVNSIELRAANACSFSRSLLIAGAFIFLTSLLVIKECQTTNVSLVVGLHESSF